MNQAHSARLEAMTIAVIALACVLTAGTARAQSGSPAPASGPQGAPATTGATAPAPPAAWSWTGAVFTYFEPDDSIYLQPTVAADRGWLHLEGRFNYEDLDTGSVWLGRNFSVGKTVTLDITPMIGAVFGSTDGVATGFIGTLAWRKLELYSETEYVFDAHASADNFLYSWSELSWNPVGGWRAGLVAQPTKVRSEDLDSRRGFLVGWSSSRMDFTLYVFEPGSSRQSVVVGVVAQF